MTGRNPGTGLNHPDVTETLGQSLIQHGKFSDRVYLMKLSKADYPDIINEADALTLKYGYTKLVAKVPDWAEEGFLDAGCVREAAVPRFFGGCAGVCFMSKFADRQRAVRKDGVRIGAVLARALDTPHLISPPVLGAGYAWAVMLPEDAPRLAALYRDVFETYPFPIHDPAFLTDAMKHDTVYFAVTKDGRLVSAASCEMDTASRNAEMTDFATGPDFRSKGLASFLLYTMESEMKTRGIKTVYTIARSLSYGMNITFSKHGYAYAGTLVNNTNISGGLESMNVWYKTLI